MSGSRDELTELQKAVSTLTEACAAAVQGAERGEAAQATVQVTSSLEALMGMVDSLKLRSKQEQYRDLRTLDLENRRAADELVAAYDEAGRFSHQLASH